MNEILINASERTTSACPVYIYIYMFLCITIVFSQLNCHFDAVSTGCLPFGTHNRRHAWEKTEGFKLGGLLDRNGFEKLDQNASDEEHDQETTTLSQFA